MTDENKRQSTYRWIAIGLVMVALVAGSFSFGLYEGKREVKNAPPPGEGTVTNRNAPPPYLLKDVDFANFWEIWKQVKERHAYQPVSDVKLYYGALQGMVAALDDPYSVYFPPDLAQKFKEELDGQFDGIGAEIGMKNDILTVIAPLAGTPADRAGLKAGDHIYAIDGMDTTGMLVDEAVNRIRGKKGTTVKLLIMREGLKQPKEIDIVRDTIVIEVVKSKVVTKNGKKIGIITITSFNDSTVDKFREAIRSVTLDGAQGIILDLRNNPGGFLTSAVKVAGEWIPQDTIVEEKTSDGKTQKYVSDGESQLTDVPSVVLVNAGSASASEIVSGALQDDGKAAIVGETTYGKGSVQDYQEYADGSAFKLTVALWYTPKGRSIDKHGITPDVIVKMTADDYDKGLDPQLDKAYSVLAERMAGRSGIPAPTPAATTTATK